MTQSFSLDPLCTSDSPRTSTDKHNSNITLTSRPDWNRAITPKKFPKAAFLTSFWREKKKRRLKIHFTERLSFMSNYSSNQWNKMAGRRSLEHPAMWRLPTEMHPPARCFRTVLDCLSQRQISAKIGPDDNVINCQCSQILPLFHSSHFSLQQEAQNYCIQAPSLQRTENG